MIVDSICDGGVEMHEQHRLPVRRPGEFDVVSRDYVHMQADYNHRTNWLRGSREDSQQAAAAPVRCFRRG